MINESKIAHAALPVARFAPSPTGPLHLGSLASAVASFLDARAQRGKWLVRMEDLDPPREMPGAADAILRSLERHHLLWDDGVLRQSRRLDAYAAVLDSLYESQLIFPCYCNRKWVAAHGGVYPGTCRHAEPQDRPAAWRLKIAELPAPYAHHPSLIEFDDIVFGPQQQNLHHMLGDFIVRRKDGLFAYQLAVAVDDWYQGITHVVRGSDLLSSTGAQIFLLRLLGAKVPTYGHVPVVVNALGQKLSKQHHAPALDESHVDRNILQALRFLNHAPAPALAGAPAPELLAWAAAHWDRGRIPRIMKLPEPG